MENLIQGKELSFKVPITELVSSREYTVSKLIGNLQSMIKFR